MSGAPTSFLRRSFPYALLLLLCTITRCLSSPGLFNFTGPNAFIEIDTQPLSCSIENQINFSLKFDVFPLSNSSVLFTGISGSLLPSNWSEDLAPDGVNFLGAQGDPLALFIYIERPYFSFMLMRLTDYQVRFYLHHTFGYFDRSWNDWHRVEIVLSKHGKSRVKATFKVDQKSNNGFLTLGNIIWPDWSKLKSFAPREIGSKRRFYFNEAFIGLPSQETMSHYAIDILVKYMDPIRTVYARTDVYESSFEKFVPFRGLIKSFLLSSDCACGILTYFGPKMIQVGPGVEITSVCDISSLPPLFSKLPGSCRSKVPGISCGCLSYTGDPICYCPLEQNCTTMKKQDAVLMRLGLLKTEIIDENVDTENYLVLTNGFPPSPSFLNEDPVTYSKLDSCFANIFLCEKPIIYEFWMHIDPLALINGSTLVMKHASYINSPWYMKIAYNGYSTRLSNSEHVMELSAEIQAPPNHIWRIERCDSNLRAVPGQWHQVKIHWDKVTLSLYLDGNLCGTAESMTSIIHGNIKQRFANRRTPFLFFGNHTIEDLIFNDKEIIPKFTHLNALSNNFDKLEPIISKITGDFYASFQLNASLEFLFIQLPGMHITKCGDDGKIAVEDKQSKECRVFQLPERCEDRDACSVEVERQGSEITAYSQDEKLSPVFEMRLCEIAKECRMREQVNQTLGLVPNTQIQLFNRGRTELEIRRHIHISKLQALNCGFNYIHSASKHSPMDLIGVCEPSLTYSRVLVKAIDSLPKSSIKGALMVSENSLLLQSKATSPEALCLRDLELCRNGMTISFWILALPTTKSSKSWPILQQTSLSGSELTVDLFRNDGQYFLDVSVKSLHTIVDGKAISALWNVNPHIENLDENWTLVTISWSHAVGLSAQFNGTIVASDRQSTETISLWEAPIHKGVWFGHQGNPDTSDGVVIDDFQFIPAEINYLDHVGQEIDVTLSNKNLNLCRLDTCWDGSSCYPISRKVDSLGPFCQCDRPRRVCRELPVGVAVYTSTFSSTTTTQAPTTISLMTTATTPLVISGQSLLSRTAIASTAQPLNSSTTPKTTTSMSLINEILQSTSDQSSPLQGRFKEAGDLSRDFEASVSHNFDKHFLLKCDPQCQNGGKCVEFNGHFSCDCSETPFWGKVCVREHVGWLSQKERVFKNEPRHRTFAAYNAVHGGSKMRLIFKTPITAVMPEKRVKKSIAAIQRSEYMVLLAVQTELGTLGLVTINSGLYILIKGVKKSMTQLLPCPQSHELITDDTLTHVIQLEHRGTLLRVKVDGVSVYPTEVIPNSCDKWLFFSPFHHINNRTYEETAIPQSNGFSPNSGKAVLGAWPDGEGEFKGAIGGWMIDGEEMFTPVSDEPEDTPNTVYRLSTRFYLTNRDFYWIRLHSLTPVTVLSDYPPVKTSPTLTVTLWFWIVGCISMGLLLLFICCWACLRVCRQQKDKRKTTWRRNYSPLKPMVAKSPSESSHIMSDTVQYYPTLVNGNGLTPKPRRLRARSLTCKVRSTVTTDNHWRARMLTLQSYQPVRRVSAFDYASMKKASMGSIYSHEERDDIEKILVTSEGDSVITLSTNHGISVKQWSAYDGKYIREILSRTNDFAQNENSRHLVLQRSENLLFTDERNFSQLYPLREQTPIASVQLPSTVWGAFPLGEEFLFVTDPMTGCEKDSFATLYFWSPSNKSIVLQIKLKVKHHWHAKGFPLRGAQKSPPLLGPNQANLLLRWILPGLPDISFSIAVNLSSIFKPPHGFRKFLIALDSLISTSLVKHDINLEKTVFLADDIVVTGDIHGALHIWNVHSGENYRSVQSDPIPFDGPLLINPGQHDFSQIKLDSETGPITTLAATEPSPTETSTFTWFCSGDDSGCVVVRRCVVSTNKSLKNVASRIHAKFRPYSRTTLAYSADTVTCARMLNRSIWRTNKPEAFLATGDSSGCIRIWLLPQCTQLAQLSASCESGLLDLELTESAPSLTVPCQWLQVVGLVRRDRTGYEHGRVVIIHLIANEENGVPNAMHSPRLRIVSKQ